MVEYARLSLRFRLTLIFEYDLAVEAEESILKVGEASETRLYAPLTFLGQDFYSELQSPRRTMQSRRSYSEASGIGERPHKFDGVRSLV